MISSTLPSTGSLAGTSSSRDIAPEAITSTEYLGIVRGLGAVGACDKEHGIVQSHLSILADLAEERDVVFAFRPVNPLATELLEQGYPTKDLNIKGKSADWGPMAGFIPVSQKFSKLAGDAQAIEKSNLQIKECIDEMHAVSTPLLINEARLTSLWQAGVIDKREKIEQDCIEIFAEKNGEQVVFEGRLSYVNQVVHYEILHNNEVVEVLAKTDPATLITKPLTADYDLLLFAVSLSNLDNQDNYNSYANKTWERSRLLTQLFRQKSAPAPGTAVESNANKTTLPRSLSSRINYYAAKTVPDRGITSRRLDAFIPAINTALGRSQTNDIVQHGADTHNPHTVTADNYPFVVFMPQRVGNFGGVVMVINKDDATDIFRDIKNSGFQFFGNEKWAKDIPPNNYRRTSYDRALEALEAASSSGA